MRLRWRDTTPLSCETTNALCMIYTQPRHFDARQQAGQVEELLYQLQQRVAGGDGGAKAAPAKASPPPAKAPAPAAASPQRAPASPAPASPASGKKPPAATPAPAPTLNGKPAGKMQSRLDAGPYTRAGDLLRAMGRISHGQTGPQGPEGGRAAEYNGCTAVGRDRALALNPQRQHGWGWRWGTEWGWRCGNPWLTDICGRCLLWGVHAPNDRLWRHSVWEPEAP